MLKNERREISFRLNQRIDVADARHRVGSFLAQLSLAEVADAVLLVLSELITNAILHGGTRVGTPVHAAVVVTPTRVTVSATQKRGWNGDPATDAAEEREGQRGLQLVEGLFGAHQVERTPDGTRVFAVAHIRALTSTRNRKDRS